MGSEDNLKEFSRIVALTAGSENECFEFSGQRLNGYRK
ncbi:hypothetical protein MNBD_NITROSPIRAE02-1365 [hydrothermal vent metagenome]|uniref:Uncharacterized protein n=1 Tax=hydrothermal vent metagenome TaxID=652676 RepID=A0A3B1D5M5_9ZZZZ